MKNTLNIRPNRGDRKRYSSWKEYDITEVLHTRGTSKDLKGNEVFMLFVRTEKHEVKLVFSREEMEALTKYWNTYNPVR